MSPEKNLLLTIFMRTTVVIGLALGIVFIPNLSVFDEQLLPEITERLSNPVNPDVEGNAIFSVYGISAASGKDPHAVGKQVIQTLQSKHPKGEFANLTEEEKATIYGKTQNPDADWQTSYPAATCNAREHADCFEQLLVQVKAKPLAQTRLLEQLQRYNNIIQQPHFIENIRLMDYTSPLPNYAIIMQLNKLRQANAYLEASIDGLIANNQADMAFWRIALQESQTLIGKMVSIAVLRNHLAGLSFAINHKQPLTQAQTAQLTSLLQQLTADEINIDESITGELRFSAENWITAPNKVPAGESALLWALTQPTANTNRFYLQTLKPAFTLSALPSAEFYERTQNSVKIPEFSRLNPYNLGGKIWLSSNWQYTDYIGRAHDLAGMYFLVALQLELNSLPEQEWHDAIKLSTYKNPYTAKPFNYDQTTKSLGFNCYYARDSCVIQLLR